MLGLLQAKKVDENGAGGLIPSQTLEEKRKAFVRPEYDFTHKSREWNISECCTPIASTLHSPLASRLSQCCAD